MKSPSPTPRRFLITRMPAWPCTVTGAGSGIPPPQVWDFNGDPTWRGRTLRAKMGQEMNMFIDLLHVILQIS